MGDAILEKYMYNGQLLDVAGFDEKYKAISPSVYEVIRVMDGKPLFLSEHYARLVNSVKSVEGEVPMQQQELYDRITELCRENGRKNHNVKLVMNDVRGGKFQNVYLFMIKTSYPTEAMYAEGVPTELFSAVRNNPQAKIIDSDLRERENAFMKEKNIFEAILVNNAEQITEGSRSNIFFIKGSEVCTAPAKDVLLGVTRQRVIRICEEHGIKVHEVVIPAGDIASFDAAFISGTSPKVLPICRIGSAALDVNNKTLRNLMKFYDEEIEKDLAK